MSLMTFALSSIILSNRLVNSSSKRRSSDYMLGLGKTCVGSLVLDALTVKSEKVRLLWLVSKLIIEFPASSELS